MIKFLLTIENGEIQGEPSGHPNAEIINEYTLFLLQKNHYLYCYICIDIDLP